MNALDSGISQRRVSRFGFARRRLWIAAKRGIERFGIAVSYLSRSIEEIQSEFAVFPDGGSGCVVGEGEHQVAAADGLFDAAVLDGGFGEFIA